MEAAKQNQGGWGLFIYLFIVCYGGGGGGGSYIYY